MARKDASERQQISVWLMAEDVRRADALAPKLAKDRTASGVGNVTRSVVLRLAVMRGLDVLEREYK